MWKKGSEVEVSWGIRKSDHYSHAVTARAFVVTANANTTGYNHGGGYQYRLCPAGDELTEACFQRTPMPFSPGGASLRWSNGTQRTYTPVHVSEGTFPPGSTWSANTIHLDPHSIELACEKLL